MAVGDSPGWGLMPESFYAMGPEEWWLMYDVRRTDQVSRSGLTDDDRDRLRKLIGAPPLTRRDT